MGPDPRIQRIALALYNLLTAAVAVDEHKSIPAPVDDFPDDSEHQEAYELATRVDELWQALRAD